MGELPYPDGSFDLIWAESSVYSIGFDTALDTWRRLLAPGGKLVVTECEWTTADPSGAARAFWDQHYPLRTPEENTRAASARFSRFANLAAHYLLTGLRVLPE